MARTNRKRAAWVIDLLHVQPSDKVLDVGFGPGAGIQLLTNSASAWILPRKWSCKPQPGTRKPSRAAGLDPRRASAESLPFEDESFDKALAINSMQVWPDAIAGLREMRRCMRGKVALGLTPYSGQPNSGLAETLTAAGFAKAHVFERDKNFCALAIKS